MIMPDESTEESKECAPSQTQQKKNNKYYQHSFHDTIKRMLFGPIARSRASLLTSESRRVVLL